MNPCEGCAFTKGAAANLEPQNYLKGQLCVQGAIPFYCHHAKDGSLQDYGEVSPSRRRMLIQSGLMVICQGWRRETANLAAKGYYDKGRDLKRAFAMLGLGALQIFITTGDKVEKEQAARNLKNVIMALNRAEGFTEIEDSQAADT